MFYQLKWFDPSLPDSVIASQAGMLHASFTAAQLCTALLWGRVADSKWAGRKTVLMIGLAGTSELAPPFHIPIPYLEDCPSLTLRNRPLVSRLWLLTDFLAGPLLSCAGGYHER